MGRVSCQPNCVGSRLILFAIWGWSFGAKGLFCIFQKVETFAHVVSIDVQFCSRVDI